jgi:hypothetical protein
LLTAQSKTGIFRYCGVAEAPLDFQAGWSDCVLFFSFFLFILFAHLDFSFKFLYSFGYVAVSKLSPDVLSGGQPREVWKQPDRLPAEGRTGSSKTQESCGVVFFCCLLRPSFHACHLLGIRSLVT